MSKAAPFLGWVAGGIGVSLAYAAYRNESPLQMLRNFFSGDQSTKPSAIDSGTLGISALLGGTGSTATASSTTGTAALVGGTGSRIQAIANRSQKPQYVTIPGHPGFVLDTDAATSFARVEAAYGKSIGLTGASRSTAEQAAGYALHPDRFAPPGHSLHEVGLAVDISVPDYDDPKLMSAFQTNGWYRQGKKGNWDSKHKNAPEPWHWSYGVPG